jgi:hypothetical protein
MMDARMIDPSKPLAVFCSQPQSQRYIKTVHNLGDSWRTLAGTSNLTSFAADEDKIIIETTFDLTITIDKQSFSVTIQAPAVKGPSGQADPSYSPSDTYVEAADALSVFPHSVLQNYNTWVDTYTDNFKKRCEDTQDYSANVFLTAAEQVAWQIAGYLLAWRIVRSPQVGSVEYSQGGKKYVLEQGRESDITLAFLEAQVLRP